ncbi:MAG: hypothetical protein ACRD16_08565 [Thermoanaerobaculia bacterium]
MGTTARTLNAILQHAETNPALKKSDLHCGDEVVIATENSIYSIVVVDDSSYSVRGGWFDREGPTPVRIPINGCTWGGSMIQTGVLAALGLRLEFANRVLTSPIRHFCVIRPSAWEADTLLARDDEQVLSGCGISWKSGAPAP